MTGIDDWPVRLAGTTESVVTTETPSGPWNVAALGIVAPDRPDTPATARTWGRTRTRRNFRERSIGYVQFTRDLVDFVEAACSIRTEPDPVLDGVDAWVKVSTEQVDSGDTAGTGWVDWALRVDDAEVKRQVVPTRNRADYAVIEATVAASRLDVPVYDRQTLRSRIAHCESIVESCGGAAHARAWDRFDELVDWRFA